MTEIFHPLQALIASATDSELAKYVEYLKEENRILRARIPGQIHTKPQERERLLKLGKVIGREARSGPIRLKQETERKQSTDGQIYHYLLAEQPSPLRGLCPYETIQLKPVARGVSTVHRPSSLFETRDLHGD